MNLIIVESPTKARTLSRFLGKGFDVQATMGHIKDLPKSKLGVDIDKNFKPHYKLLPKKSDSIKKIKEAAEKAKIIYLATDPDREGEAIAQHTKEILNDNGKTNLKRIVFHEITKDAVEKAIESPREIDDNLVDAQIARRVLDRLVGYKLSPLLWKKVRRGLSAGRVQSVAVRLIVEKEREIEAFDPEEYWHIFADVKPENEGKDKTFRVQLARIDDESADISKKKLADLVVKDLEKSKYRILNVERKEVKKSPYPPFTTSTLTQTAARFYGWSSKRTMAVAQRLYEQGLITYHRTDSVHLSKSALSAARKYIQQDIGEKYLPKNPRHYKTKAKVAQEAHEAIRPTQADRKKKELTDKGGIRADHKKLYELIWKRFIASQMTDTVYDQTKIEVLAQGDKKYILRASGRVMKFDGWRKIIPASKKEDPKLPSVESGQVIDLVDVISEQKFTQPPARYNEASLIKTLEKLGIGRPSTYAPIISTIQSRQYVEKDEGKFKPTPIGTTVNDFLLKHFPDVFDYSFTAEMEDDLDDIANGEEKWKIPIKEFWGPFEKKLEETEAAKRVKIETEKLDKKCPKCDKGELVIRVGRYGKFISCSRFPDCDYTDKYLEKIGMKCPDCVAEGLPAGKQGEVIVKKTRKGKKFYGCSRYPKCKFASWKNPKKKKK